MSNEFLNTPKPSPRLCCARLKAWCYHLSDFFTPKVNLKAWLKYPIEGIESRFEKLSSASKVKSVKAAFNNYHAQDMCDAIYHHPASNEIIALFLSPLTSLEKIQLLKQAALDEKKPTGVLEMLLWQADKNKSLLAALFNPLSSQERIEVLTELYNTSSILGEPEVTPEIMAILLDTVSAQDRFTFLSTLKHNRSILMHLISHTPALPSKDIQGIKIQILELFFKDLPPDAIVSLLTYKQAFTPEGLASLGLEEAFLQQGGVSALDFALHNHHSELARFLSQTLTLATFNNASTGAIINASDDLVR